MGLILIRYGELGLKSRPVRMRFERTLLKNIEDIFLREKEECLTSREWGRMMVHVKDDGKAIPLLRRVFGITSVSPAVECTSGKDEIADTVGKRSVGMVKDGSSFAIRARRNGTHPYTSQELAAYVAGSVWKYNKGLNLSVDLDEPDVEISVEVREKKAFIFVERYSGPGGLPLGTQGRVLVPLEDERSAAAAWLIMKRGCWPVLVSAGARGTEMFELLGKWATNLTLHQFKQYASVKTDSGPPYLSPQPGTPHSVGELADYAKHKHCEAIVSGQTYSDLEQNIPTADMPILFPLCGLSTDELGKLIKTVREG